MDSSNVSGEPASAFRQSQLAKATDFLSPRPPTSRPSHSLDLEFQWAGLTISTKMEISGEKSADVLSAATAWTQLFGGLKGDSCQEDCTQLELLMVDCGRRIATAGCHRADEKDPTVGAEEDSIVGAAQEVATCEEAVSPLDAQLELSTTDTPMHTTLEESHNPSPGAQAKSEAMDTPTHETLDAGFEQCHIPAQAVQSALVSCDQPPPLRQPRAVKQIEVLQDDNLRSVASLLAPKSVASLSVSSRRCAKMTGWPLDLSRGFRALPVQTVLQLCDNSRFKLMGFAIHGGSSPSQIQHLLTACSEIRRVLISGWRHCDSPLAGVPRHTALRSIECEGATQLTSLESLVNCPHVECISLSGCHALQDISGVQACEYLAQLSLAGCSSLACSGLDSVAHLSRLQELNLTACFGLTAFPALPAGLKKLWVERCLGLADISAVSSCCQLKSLSIVECSALSNLSALAQCPQLQTLNLTGCSLIDSLDSSLPPGLLELNLSGCRQLASVDKLSSCTELRVLSVSSCVALTDFSTLSKLSKLQELDLTELGIKSIPAEIACCPHLNTLDVSRCAQLTDLSELCRAPWLECLFMCNCVSLEELAPLAHLVNLKQLKLSGSASVADLSPLSPLTQLRVLDIDSCDRIANLCSLGSCGALQELHAAHCSSLSSVAPLAACAALTLLDLAYCCTLRQSTVPQREGLTVKLDWLTGTNGSNDWFSGNMPRNSSESLALPLMGTPLSSRSRTGSFSDVFLGL
eukprot:TRINITY_DN16066_c0_g1_i1.p1 TRINITY_DN16066_c0_g1~~TRINITY_DN16066_c0_g1_i1.p1  ORF type:complete len:750 (+),score=128.29 TRINITY_DN16066_c0_g1_i1:1-2250(+)